MFNRKIKTALAVMVLMFVFAGNVFAAEEDFYFIDNGEGQAVILDYTGSDTNLVIPSTLGGLDNIIISDYAFENKGLQTVEIPESVTQIVTDAFIGNPDLIIYGYTGSVAETYALNNSHTFIALDGTGTPDEGTGTETEPTEPTEPEVTIPQTAQSDTTVEGEIQPIVLEFSVPVKVTFVIDPNQEEYEERFISPSLTVSNDTNAPIRVSIEDFEMTQDTNEKGYQSVLPSLYTDEEWKGLNKAESKNIAIGIKADTNWLSIENPDTLYANNFSNEVIGVIAENGSADFTFEAKHGSAFDYADVIDYTVSFVIELN